METNGIKIQFGQNHRSMIARPSLELIHSGHLVFNIPNLTSKNNISHKPTLKEKTEDFVDEKFPFFSLTIKNQAEVFRVGTSFVNDIQKGQKQFGFSSLFKDSNESHILSYASFVNYTLKSPVLIVVKDLSDKTWDQYRGNFTAGSLWKWNCSDWSGLCFIDHKQIALHANSFNNVDFDEISKPFSAIMWSLPEGDLSNSISKNAISILQKINSVTFLIKEGETSGRKLMEMHSYYKCFGIPVKGVLREGKA